MGEVTVYRVPQFIGRGINVICLNGIPVYATRRRKKATEIVSMLLHENGGIKNERV